MKNRDKIIQGLEKAYQKLIEFKKYKKSPLIIPMTNQNAPYYCYANKATLIMYRHLQLNIPIGLKRNSICNWYYLKRWRNY